jgi:hypothetical protein
MVVWRCVGCCSLKDVCVAWKQDLQTAFAAVVLGNQKDFLRGFLKTWLGLTKINFCFVMPSLSECKVTCCCFWRARDSKLDEIGVCKYILEID